MTNKLKIVGSDLTENKAKNIENKINNIGISQISAVAEETSEPGIWMITIEMNLAFLTNSSDGVYVGFDGFTVAGVTLKNE